MDWLSYFLVAHLVGDFVLQNDWMAVGKKASSWVCGIHVATYMVPFAALCAVGAPLLPVLLIGAEHFLQDRFRLHLRWMHFYRHSTVDNWPVGPLCVDQAMHVGWIAVAVLLSEAI